MTPLLPAAAGALVVAGCIGLVAGLRRRPEPAGKPARQRRPRRLARLRRPWDALPRRRQVLAVAGIAVGVGAALVTGWLLAVVLTPAAAIGIPVLLSPPPSTARIDKLEALEEWSRAMAGVLVAGQGLEQAILSTVRSTPEAIRPEVTGLAARLRARWSTEDALRAFADDLDDATGDLVAAYLLLGAKKREHGLATVLTSLAESVAADVRGRRQVEADRAKPRATARWVTLITIAVLAVLAVTGDYIQPYTSGIGQLVLTALLALYVATLVWMRRMTVGKPPPRFLTEPGGLRDTEAAVSGPRPSISPANVIGGGR